MKSPFTLLISTLFVNSLHAQPAIQWQKSLGGSNFDEVSSIKETKDGNYIAAGFTASNNGDIIGNHGTLDMLVVKYNNIGNIIWQKTYGGSNIDWAYAMENTLDGGYIVTGFTDSDNGNVSGNHGGSDAWVVKLNNLGDIQWQKCLGGSGWDEAWAIAVTLDGGYIVAGRSNSTNGDVSGNHGGLDYWVVKLNGSGSIEWQKCYGGSSEDNAYAVRQTSDGGYIVTGEALSNNGDVSGNHGDADYWVIKLSPTGNLEWQKCLGGSGLDRANGIVEAEDGGYVVMGQASSNNGDITHPRGGYDIWVAKITHNGALEWEKSFGGSDQDWGQEIQKTKEGGYVLIGSAWSKDGDIQDTTSIADFWVLKLSREGGLEWQKSLGGSIGETGRSIQQTSDDGYIVGGRAWSNDGDLTQNKGKSDFWVIKLSPLSVGVENTPGLSTIPLEIHPNPATELISLNIGTFDQAIQVRVMDMHGRTVLRKHSTSSRNLDVSGLPSGVSISGGLYVGKFLKE
jgi:Secretion system C-terminal sorting domain